MESHGGTTFCALAALNLSGQLDLLSDSVKEKMTRWLMFRQVRFLAAVSQKSANYYYCNLGLLILVFRTVASMDGLIKQPIRAIHFGFQLQ